ncbi:hypothetical protein BGZ83_003057 [Gryganskiella cystojenkinii]|nr:hypothetical protein BGZ83_003057 [Gryganskiella cystojenkinii]
MTSPPQSPLAVLPTECLEIIIGHLRYDLSSLHNLLLVSRQFFVITVPVLYKSPFRLAAASLPDAAIGYSAPLSRSTPFLSSHQPGTNWEKFLVRIKLLTRLLIKNLQIPAPGGMQQQRLRRHSISILDDSSGMENLQPLIPALMADCKGSTWLQSPNQEKIPRDSWPKFDGNANAVISSNQSISPSNISDSSVPCADLISFEYESWDQGGSSSSSSTKTGSSGSSENSITKRLPVHDSGLLMDYFYFYTDQDHRPILAVIRQIYPGAGRRAYDKYLSELELAILRHNPSKIESIHIHAVSPVVLHLLKHLKSFKKLSSIELHDAVWSKEELQLVHKLLKEYSVLFPAADAFALGDAGTDDLAQHNRSLLGRSTYRTNAIRSLKYATSRSHGDGSRIDGQEFNPIQLVLALGPGVEVIDMVHWSPTTLAQLDSIDAGALLSLRIAPMMTLYEDAAFSRHEFLSRCRKLQLLDLFSSSKDMFNWAVTEWDMKCHRSTTTTQTTATTLKVANGMTEDRSCRALVPLAHLRIHGPRDSIIYEIVRDALYGFRNSLQVLLVFSDSEHVAEPEWMDQQTKFISGKAYFAQQPHCDDRLEQVMEKATNAVLDDRECYRKLSSIASSPLLIQWDVPHLSILSLTGSFASEFDIESLRHMLGLRTLSLTITQATSGSNARMGQRGTRAPSNLTFLPFVAGPRLQRIMIKGPWYEISDETLWEMICPDTEIPAPFGHCRHDSCGSFESADEDTELGADKILEFLGDDIEEEDPEEHGEDEHCGEWAAQLIEFSVLDNPMVTVPGMLRLARRMNQLEIMGTDLNMMARTVEQQQRQERNTGRRQQQDQYQQQSYQQSSNNHVYDQESRARRMLSKMRVRCPWLDLGPDAQHLGQIALREKYLRTIT